jgi:hypothetical protein
MQHRRQLSRQPRLQYPPTFEPVACSPCVRAAARRAHHMSVGPQSRHCAPLRPQGHATSCDSFRATPLWQDCVSAVSATLSPPLCTVTRANGLHHYLPLESLFLLCTRRVRPVYSCSRRQTMGVVMQDHASRVHYRPWQSNKPPANEPTILCSMRSCDITSNWTGCVGKQNKFGISQYTSFSSALPRHTHEMQFADVNKTSALTTWCCCTVKQQAPQRCGGKSATGKPLRALLQDTTAQVRLRARELANYAKYVTRVLPFGLVVTVDSHHHPKC